MKKITTAFFLGISIISSAQDKKKFFDHIEVMLNLHVGGTSVKKDGWGQLLKKTSPDYSIDTFYHGKLFDPLRRHRMTVFSSASVGVRLSKTVVKGNEKNQVPERLEWRLAVIAGTTTRNRDFYCNYDYNQPLPSGEFTFRVLDLTYQRHCIDINSLLVYKFNYPFFKDKNKPLFVGMGAGIRTNLNSHIKENFFTYRATPPSTVTEENNISRFEKAKTRIDPYFSMVCGGEVRCSDRFSILFEITATANNQPYNSSAYFSTVCRLKL